jgi:hypothetical protein
MAASSFGPPHNWESLLRLPANGKHIIEQRERSDHGFTAIEYRGDVGSETDPDPVDENEKPAVQPGRSIFSTQVVLHLSLGISPVKMWPPVGSL